MGELTLADWARRMDPEGKIPAMVELLSQTNGMLEAWSETTGAVTMLELKCGTYVIALQDLSALKQAVLFLDAVTRVVTREVSDKSLVLRNEVYQLKLAEKGGKIACELLKAERDTAVTRLNLTRERCTMLRRQLVKQARKRRRR